MADVNSPAMWQEQFPRPLNTNAATKQKMCGDVMCFVHKVRRVVVILISIAETVRIICITVLGIGFSLLDNDAEAELQVMLESELASKYSVYLYR